MVDTSVLESYLNERSVKTGEIVTIIGEGVIEEIPQKDGKTRKGLTIPVSVAGRELEWSPGKTATKPLQKAWGLNTKEWVKKKGKVAFISQLSFGEMKNILILDPVE